jgi:hypothetical protein
MSSRPNEVVNYLIVAWIVLVGIAYFAQALPWLQGLL